MNLSQFHYWTSKWSREAKETDIGLTGGGKGTHQIYVNGITDHIIRNENVADYIVNFVQKNRSKKNNQIV